MGGLLMETLYYAANPVAYVATQHAGKGFFFSIGKGACLLDFDIRGVSGQNCTYAAGAGKIDESASLESSAALNAINVSGSVIEGGELTTQVIPARLEGFQPLRAFFLGDAVGRDVPGGKTLYRVEVVTDCQDTIHVNVLRRASSRDPFQARTWRKILPAASSAGIVTSGLEFMIMLYVKGGGKFRIFRVTAWFKLTDRRGLHTFGGLSDNASSADQGA